MASLHFRSVTNYRASTDYGIADSSLLPLQPRDDNLNQLLYQSFSFLVGRHHPKLTHVHHHVFHFWILQELRDRVQLP